MPATQLQTSLLKEKNLQFALVILWLAVQFFLYSWYGIRIVYDSNRYFAYAEAFMNNSNFWYLHSAKFYLTYTLLITFFLHIAKLSITWVILFQVILSGIAAVYVYKCTYIIIESKGAAALAALFFIIWPDLQFWNLYIHTESIYISLSVFILYLLLTARKPLQYAFLASLLVIAIFLRPNGIFLAIAVGVGFAYKYRPKLYFQRPYSRFIIVAALAFILLLAGISFLEIFSPIGYYRAGQLIQGYDGLVFSLVPSFTNETAQPVAVQLLTMMLQQPLLSFKLLAGRFVFFWAQVRPYYSAVHNIVILMFYLPLYYFCCTWLSQIKNREFAAFMITLAILHTLMVTIIAVDWDNRFIVPLLPFVFMAAAIGIVSKYGHTHA